MPSAVAACLNFFCGFYISMQLLEKKFYLIDFTFKFNEIKFCNLLMNWFIREKVFTYFYKNLGLRIQCVM
jgi:hypothetical protein